MAKKIIDMVREKRDRMDKPGGEDERDENGFMAVAAIYGGIESDAWREYMIQFVETDAKGTPLDPRQLDRLLATDGTLGDPELNFRRAYLVSNGPCTAASPGRFEFDFNVESIDMGLDNPCPPDQNAAPLPDAKKRPQRNR